MEENERSDLVRLSFWKPDPVPPKDAKICPIELLPLGKLKSVANKLLDVPHMTKLPTAPWESNASETASFLWQVDEGVILKVHAEQGPPKPGEVLTINARNAADGKVFYRLYVQIFEYFGATVLDEQSHQFVTPKEFKTKLAG
ncbi:MAG TPA: hypothetical protein VGP72_29195 [Planctomycetota bacterium]|jgi:hypothetical protein